MRTHHCEVVPRTRKLGSGLYYFAECRACGWRGLNRADLDWADADANTHELTHSRNGTGVPDDVARWVRAHPIDH